MESDLRPVLQKILDKLDGMVARLDAIDGDVKLARDDARAAREEAHGARMGTEQLARVTTVLGQEFKNLSGMVGVIASAQAEMAKQLGEMNERLGR